MIGTIEVEQCPGGVVPVFRAVATVGLDRTTAYGVDPFTAAARAAEQALACCEEGAE